MASLKQRSGRYSAVIFFRRIANDHRCRAIAPISNKGWGQNGRTLIARATLTRGNFSRGHARRFRSLSLRRSYR